MEPDLTRQGRGPRVSTARTPGDAGRQVRRREVREWSFGNRKDTCGAAEDPKVDTIPC